MRSKCYSVLLAALVFLLGAPTLKAQLQDPPAGVIEGINYIDDSTVILELLAPYKTFCYLLGDFNGWTVDSAYLMHKSLDSQYYWIQVGHLTPQQQYLFQYDVDGVIRIADPYCEQIADPGADAYIPTSIYPNLPTYPTNLTTGIAGVLQTAQTPYQWGDSAYKRPDKHNLVIYEILIRDFEPTDWYAQLADSIRYMKTLGVNAIELMPIMNNEGTSSWGYNCNFFLAPEKIYGPRGELKHLIDVCHQDSMAVILDIPFNDAFSSDPMVQLYWDTALQEPAANNPWFNQVAPHPYSVGYDFNHNSPYTQHYVDRTTAFWIQQYHADGYRFDLAKGYTQTYSGSDVTLWGDYDTMRIRLVERLSDAIWNNVDSNAILIMEYFANNPEQQILSGHNKGIMMWGFDMNTNYSQATEGYANGSDLSAASWEYDGWAAPNEVAYMESHDEERVMYNNEQYADILTGYDGQNLDTALDRMECAGTLFFPLPGPKMLWMFGERGYDISINFNSRTGVKPPHWEYMSNPHRLHLYKVWSALIKLKLNYSSVFTTTNYTQDVANIVKRIWLTDSIFDVAIIGNFSDSRQTEAVGFQHTGWWYDYMTGDSINVTNTSTAQVLVPAEYHLYTDKSLPVPDLTVPSDPGTGINEIYSNDHITVYPQPTHGLVNFESDDDPIQRISVYDIQSRLIYQQDFGTGMTGEVVRLPESVTTGIYLYTVTTTSAQRTGKLVYTK